MRRARRKKRVVESTVVVGEDAEQSAGRGGRALRVLLWILLVLVVLTLSVGGAAYYGLNRGERARAAHRQEVADEHYQKGLERLDAGQFELAIAEFEYVLKLDPDHGRAERGIAEAERRIAERPTPTIPPTEPSPEIAAEDLYEEALTRYEQEAWQDAASTLTQLRALAPEYQPEAVEEMLFQSLYNAGIELLDEGALEEGIFYLDQAVALRPLDEEARAERSLAIDYMTALGYWSVNWERCIERFEALYARAPGYRDVHQRLYRAHVIYADAWFEEDEMCPAETHYAQALQFMEDPEVEAKRAEAAELCLIATPTPIAPLEGSDVITLTELPPGFTGGKLTFPMYNEQAGRYDLYTLSADKQVVRLATGADQPSAVRGSGAVAYRDLNAASIGIQVPGQAGIRQLAGGTGASWPTLSPDGTRVAYAEKDAAGRWQIYIAPVDGSAEPTLLAAGTGPAWGPNGWLAWNGCAENGVCGITIDDPDDDRQPQRLSTNEDDIALNWSPDGGSLAYMSDHTGNWEIYLVSIAGGFEALTQEPEAADGLPAWSPDGSTFAFVSNRDGAWGLYLMARNGEDPHKILSLGPNLPSWTQQRITWSP